jgi:TP53 regulating kinase-like protein
MILKTRLLALGAESEILHVEKWGRSLVVKKRPKKPYLLSNIDEQLRTTRTSKECKMLTVARTFGVPTPSVYSVDLLNKSITMDFIDGEQFKVLVDTTSPENLRKLCHQFGHLIGLLHLGGLVHGDPTTSNILVDQENKMWMIDFGLAELNASVEMKGVDLHLIRRALETTHWEYQEDMLKDTLEGYSQTVGDDAKELFTRMEEIRERGRYH